MPTVAVLSFPGNNCEVESLRSLNAVGLNACLLRWNASDEQLQQADGFFLPGGFSYEDRGRSGMVAARDRVLAHLSKRAEEGTAIIGNCNGAQVLIESGLVPLDGKVRMALAKNVTHGKTPGFLSQWVWIAPSCARGRCATSDWNVTMHVPIAHGEGRFTTTDPDVLAVLEEQDQIAFRYCDEQGNFSNEAPVTPNGSMKGIAGICNPHGNVVALMPHPERTDAGLPYFASLKKWMERGVKPIGAPPVVGVPVSNVIGAAKELPVELFIGAITANNEEWTLQQLLQKHDAASSLKQFRYIGLSSGEPKDVLRHPSRFNHHKERAFIRRGGKWTTWNYAKSSEVDVQGIVADLLLLRRDLPDTESDEHSTIGVAYALKGKQQAIMSSSALAILSNPHSSVLERLPS